MTPAQNRKMTEIIYHLCLHMIKIGVYPEFYQSMFGSVMMRYETITPYGILVRAIQINDNDDIRQLIATIDASIKKTKEKII